jgi:tRNA pseudouridine38-40 synthase
MNSLLPKDIRIMSCEFAAPEFHSRKSALLREYIYQISNAPVVSALNARYTCNYRFPLDVNKLKAYCNILIGEHDFTSFCSLNDSNKNKIRNIHAVDINKENDIIRIRITGNAFLYNMIRIIAGTMIMLHKKDAKPEEMKIILDAKDRKFAGPTFPAKGLIFNKVYYDKKDIK